METMMPSFTLKSSISNQTAAIPCTALEFPQSTTSTKARSDWNYIKVVSSTHTSTSTDFPSSKGPQCLNSCNQAGPLTWTLPSITQPPMGRSQAQIPSITSTPITATQWTSMNQLSSQSAQSLRISTMTSFSPFLGLGVSLGITDQEEFPIVSILQEQRTPELWAPMEY